MSRGCAKMTPPTPAKVCPPRNRFLVNSKINDNLFDIRIDLSKLQYYIDKHDLKYIDRYKRYCIENIEIVSNGKTMDYKKTEYEMIGDIIKKTECNYFKFSFYEVDYSETYDLYKRDNIELITPRHEDYD